MLRILKLGCISNQNWDGLLEIRYVLRVVETAFENVGAMIDSAEALLSKGGKMVV